MLSKWMKRGLVSGLFLGSVVLVAGCAQQQAPAPAPEAPQTEAPSADTTMSAAQDTTGAATMEADTTKAAEPTKEDTTTSE